MDFDERVKARDEARILEVLNHPNIIKFKDVFKDKKMFLNVVMEYADDGDLISKMKMMRKNNQRFTEDEILDIFTQLCLALKHIHDRKILHRDLKPHNIFLTRRGIVKLGDFGVSKVLNRTKSKASTLIGTPVYLAPEIINGKGYDMKSDMWAIGIILYEMMAM